MKKLTVKDLYVSTMDMTKPIVILDEGHRVDTPGKRDGGLLEYEFNEDLGGRIGKLLEPYVSVFYTITSKKHPNSEMTADGRRKNLSFRSGNANSILYKVRLQCQKNKIAEPKIILVSLHANAASNRTTSGWEVFIYARGGQADELAKSIVESSKKHIGLGTAIKNRGIKVERFHMVNSTKMPAVLLEHEFYTNDGGRAKLKSSVWRDKFAKADADGILNYLGIAGGVVSQPVAKPSTSVAGSIYHQVVVGDTLWSISEKYNVPIDTIKKLNDLQTNVIYSHMNLLIKPAKLESKPETKPTTTLTNIVGRGTLTKGQMVAVIKKYNPNANLKCTIEEWVDFVIDECIKENINHDVLFAQSCKETGYFKYGGQVLAEQNNYAGIGATNNSPIGKGAWFDTPVIGIRAQAQHLKAYATTDKLSQPCVDPRYDLVNPKGFAPYVEWLGSHENPKNYVGGDTSKGLIPNKFPLGWAHPGTTYGKDIVKMIEGFKTFKGVDVEVSKPVVSDDNIDKILSVLSSHYALASDGGKLDTLFILASVADEVRAIAGRERTNSKLLENLTTQIASRNDAYHKAVKSIKSRLGDSIADVDLLEDLITK